MLPFTHFNWDEFERDFLLMEDESSAQSVRGGISAVKLENHVDGEVGKKPVLVLTKKLRDCYHICMTNVHDW